MERKLYLELCQRQSMKGGVLVEYGGIAYQPYSYELKFQQDSKINSQNRLYRTIVFNSCYFFFSHNFGVHINSPFL